VIVKLGIVITENRLTAPALALMGMAADRGIELRCFLSDSGVEAMHDPHLQKLVAERCTTLAVCEHSMERYGIHVPKPIDTQVVVGGQYQDAELVRWSDRVAVF